jgi:hypothetical protein
MGVTVVVVGGGSNAGKMGVKRKFDERKVPNQRSVGGV